MGALQFVDVPGYAALILRRTYSDLTKPGALMDRARDWLGGTEARFADKEHTWTFPSGASLTFGNLETEKDRFMYQSSELNYVGFDELTQFTLGQYQYLFSRVRRPKTGPLAQIPLRVRSASNPGNSGHSWVQRRFILPWKLWKEGKGPKPARSFHPAVLDDLAEIMDIAAYEEQLKELNPVEYAQLRYGNWDIKPEGRMFNPAWFKTIRRADIPAEIDWVRFWDLAATEPKPGTDPDYTAGALMGRDPRTGLFYLANIFRFRRSPEATEKAIRKTAERDGYEVPIVIEQEPGSSGKSLVDVWARRVLYGFSVRGLRATGSKITRATPLTSAAEKGHLLLLEGVWNEGFLDEAELFPDPGNHDDQVDAVSGAHMVLTRSEGSHIMAIPLSLTEPSLWRI